MLKQVKKLLPLGSRTFVSELRNPVANPKKLQKQIQIPKNIQWLHKDVKVVKRKSNPELNTEDLEVMTQRLIRSTLGYSSLNSIQNFCMEFVNRLGSDAFQTFIGKHELAIPKLHYSSHYRTYLKACFKTFKQDHHLLYLFTFCDLRQLTRERIPKLINEESFDCEQRNAHRFKYYSGLIPDDNKLFDDYSSNDSAPPFIEINIETLEPEYISNESDLPNVDGLVTDRGYNTDVQKTSKNPRSLSELIRKKNALRVGKPTLDRIMAFKQDPTETASKSNWVYIQVDLGKDELLEKDKVRETLEKAGITGIKTITIFHNEPKTDSEENEIESELSKLKLEISSSKVDVEQLANLAESSKHSYLMQAPGKPDEALTGLSTHSSEIERDTQRIKDMIKITSRVPPSNRAYGFVEFKDYSKKQLATTSHYRLFGLEMEKALLVTEDADAKKTLRIWNLPWNLDPNHFTNWLNNTIAEAGLKNISFSVESEFQHYVSDASYVFLALNSFSEALKVFRVLNKCEYHHRRLYTDFRRGCARFISGQMVENHFSASQQEKEKQHIDRRSRKKQAWEKQRENNNF